MNDVIVVRNCIHCNKMHVFGISIKKIVFFASGGSALTPTLLKLSTVCPENNEEFIVSTVVIPEENVDYESVSLSTLVNVSIEVEKISEKICPVYKRNRLLDDLQKSGNLGQFTLAIPPGGLDYNGLNIIAIL